MDYLETYMVIDNLNGYYKMFKTSVSAMDGSLVGRWESTHSGVLLWRLASGLVCASHIVKLLVVVVHDSHRVKAGLLH